MHTLRNLDVENHVPVHVCIVLRFSVTPATQGAVFTLKWKLSQDQSAVIKHKYIHYTPQVATNTLIVQRKHSIPLNFISEQKAQ